MIVSPNSAGSVPLLANPPTDCCQEGVPMSGWPDFLVKGAAGGGNVLNLAGQTVGSASASQVTVTLPNGDTQIFSVISVSASGTGNMYAEVNAGGKTFYTPLVNIRSCDTDMCISFGMNCDSKTLGPKSHTNVFDFDKANIIQTTPETVDEPITDGFQRSVSCYSLKRNKYTFDICLSSGFHAMLNCLDQYDWVKIIDKKGNCEYDLDPSSIDISGSGDCLYAANVTFAHLDSWIGSKGCECSEFEDPDDPDNCDPTPNECEACTAEVVESGGVLTVNISSPPPGNPTITWTKNGSYLGTGNTVNTNFQPGSYVATISFDGCPSKSTGYTLLDCCANFRCTATVAGDKIDGVVNGLHPDDTVMWEVCDQDGAVVATELPYTGAEPGNYIVKATTEKGCECIQSVLVTEDGCEHSVRVDKADGTMTGVIEDCPDGSTPEYYWEQQSEGGGRTQVGTGATYTPTETGLFWFIGVCGDCAKELANFCIVEEEEECIKVEIKNFDEIQFPEIPPCPAPEVNIPPCPDIDLDGVIEVLEKICEKLEDEDEECNCNPTYTCNDCVLTLTGCEGWTIGEWTGSVTGGTGQSGPGPIQLSDQVSQTYTATASKDGCPSVTLSYTHTPGDAGIVNPNPPDVDPV